MSFVKLSILCLLCVHLVSGQALPSNTTPPGKLQAKQLRKQSRSTQPDQYGTEQRPFVVEALPPPKTQEQVEEESRERKQKEENDGNLVKFTKELVLATGVLAFIGFLQLVVFGLQAQQLRKTVTAAKESSDALMNIERPWLLITYLFVETGSDRKMTFGFQVKNFGKSPAWIKKMGGSFETLTQVSDLPKEPLYRHTAEDEGNVIVVVPVTIDSESQRSFRVPHSGDSADSDWVRVVQTKDRKWFAYGFVVYEDIFGRTHETRFCSEMNDWPNFRLTDAGQPYNYHT